MSDNDSIFNNDPSSTQEASNTTQTPDMVSELVGEGKKYSTTEEALKALVFSQEHIKTIEGENKQLRADMENAKRVEDVLNKLDQRVDESLTERQEINPVDIDKLLEEKLTAREKMALQDANELLRSAIKWVSSEQ